MEPTTAAGRDLVDGWYSPMSREQALAFVLDIEAAARAEPPLTVERLAKALQTYRRDPNPRPMSWNDTARAEAAAILAALAATE